MKYWIMISLVLLSWKLSAQPRNARYCEFSDLRLSSDSTALLFNAEYFEEGQHQGASALINNLKTGELTCINPQPLRFAISGNGKYLLFSALFGIFFQELADSGFCRQLTFLNPASAVYLRDLGFFAADSGVFWTTENYHSELLEKKFWQIQTDSSAAQRIVGISEIPAPVKWKKSSLTVADPNSGRKNEIKLAKQKLRLSITSGAAPDFDLSDISFQKSASGKKKSLFSKVRPWLISVSPTQKWIIFSIWQKAKGESSWLNLAGTDSLTEIGAGAFKYVSWIDSIRFVGLNPQGLFQYSTDALVSEPLLRCQFPHAMVVTDSARVGQTEIQVGTQVFKIENAPGTFIRSRIRVTNSATDTTQIWVPEMSNLDQKW